MVRIIARTFVGVIVPVLIAMAILTACGGGSDASTSNTSSNTNSANGNGTTGSGTRPNAPISGTIQQYDAAKQALTVKETNGSTQTFTIQKNRILKDQKITQQEFSTLLGNSGVTVRVIGKLGSDGTYTAQTLIVMSARSGNGGQNAPGAGGGTPPPNGGQNAPGAGSPNGNNGGNRGVTLRDGKMQNNQLVGTNRNGKSITVNLSGSTTMIQQTTATESDLKSGLTVSVASPPAQNGSTATAAMVTIGDSQLLAAQPGA
jgi:predicted outer membrane protein